MKVPTVKKERRWNHGGEPVLPGAVGFSARSPELSTRIASQNWPKRSSPRRSESITNVSSGSRQSHRRMCDKSRASASRYRDSVRLVEWRSDTGVPTSSGCVQRIICDGAFSFGV